MEPESSLPYSQALANCHHLILDIKNYNRYFRFSYIIKNLFSFKRVLIGMNSIKSPKYQISLVCRVQCL